MISAAKALKQRSGSRMVVVTDNNNYGRLICATIHKLVQLHPNLLKEVDLSEVDSNSFQKVPVSVTEGDVEQISSISMYEGQPNETIGYPSTSNEKGGSYFDRLWRAGASTHAERNKRFIIVLTPGIKS